MPLIPELGKLQRYKAYAYYTHFSLPEIVFPHCKGFYSVVGNGGSENKFHKFLIATSPA